jgi:hypothetical protein
MFRGNNGGLGLSAAEDTESNARLDKWAGWLGLLATAAFLATIGVTSANSSIVLPDGPADILSYLAEVAEGATGFYVYGIAGLILTVLYVPMAFGVYRLLSKSALGWLGTAALVIGLAILFPAYLVSILNVGALAPAAELVGVGGADGLYTVYTFAAVAASVLFTVGSVLTLSVGPFLWGIEGLRGSAFARWLAWTGVVTGLSGLVWFIWTIDNPVILSVLTVNVLGALVLFTGLSVRLLRR